MTFLKKLAKKIILWQAKLVLRKYKPKIIAISGSVGKTLTREAIYLILSKKYFVRRSEKSFTAELGIPMTIIGCGKNISTFFGFVKNILFGLSILVQETAYPDWLILELDCDKEGDLNTVSSYIQPDVLVMTAIGEIPAHIEYFGSIDTFLLEKKLIIEAVKPNGIVIYNADDTHVFNLSRGVVSKKIACGTTKEVDIHGSDFSIIYGGEDQSPQGMSFDVDMGPETYPITIMGSLGIQNEYACLLAFAVGVHIGLEGKDISRSLSKYKSLHGRMNIITGIKNTIIIDDSYNSSPVASSQSLFALSLIACSGRKIGVFGDMLELGKYSAHEHKKIAEQANNLFDLVVCVGIRMKKVRDELLDLGWGTSKVISCDSSVEAGRILQNVIQSGDLMLVKGSQAMRMERAVEEVMANPGDKAKLLVRQGNEWLAR